MSKKLTSEKAKEILRDGTAQGHKLTTKQKRYFGYIAGGGTPKGASGAKVDGDPIKLGQYTVDSDVVRNIVKQSRLQGVDPLEALSIAYQESGIDSKNPYHLNPDYYNGRNLGDPKSGVESIVKQMQYAKQMQGRGIVPTGDAFRLQGYNGYGRIVKGHADLEGAGSVYGVPIPERGINFKKTPLYGERILDIRDNIIKKNKDILDILNEPPPIPIAPDNHSLQNPKFIPTMSHGGSMNYNGSIIKSSNMNRKYKGGGSITPLSDNPTSNGIFRFNGPSHEEGGIPITYANQGVEVEGDETGFIGKDGDLTVFGNMKVPGTNLKFKNFSKEIAKKEKSTSNLMDKAMQLINHNDPYDRWERLKFNAGTLMASGAQKKQEDLTIAKEGLAMLQQSMLAADLDKFERTKAAKGATLGDPTEMYNTLKAQAQAKLQAMYPGKQIRIEDAGERDIRTQRGLKGRGASKTSVSLHNFGGAKDYLIYVDNKLIEDPAIYKQAIQAPAKALGMYTIGDWDPGHVGLVEEGKGNAFKKLMQKYPNLVGTERFRDSVGYLENLVNTGQADRQEISAYNQLTRANIPFSKASKNAKYDPVEGFYFGENRLKPPPVGWNLPPTPPEDIVPPEIPSQPLIVPNQPSTPPAAQIPPIQRNKRPTFEGWQPVPWTQIIPEMVALFDEPDFVPGQRYDPKLYQPYQVSFQDRLNENNASFRAAAMQMSGNNASALSVLAGQKYMADSQVAADEFRTNQGITNDITNKNITLLNDAQLKNLQLADTQFVRQEQAKSNTRQNVWNAANSISSKIAQNSLESKQYNAISTLFPQYKFDRYGNLQYIPNTNQQFAPSTGQPSTDSYYQRTREEYNGSGTLKKTVINTPSEAEKAKLDFQNWNNSLKQKTNLSTWLRSHPFGT